MAHFESQESTNLARYCCAFCTNPAFPWIVNLNLGHLLWWLSLEKDNVLHIKPIYVVSVSFSTIHSRCEVQHPFPVAILDDITFSLHIWMQKWCHFSWRPEVEAAPHTIHMCQKNLASPCRRGIKSGPWYRMTIMLWIFFHYTFLKSTCCCYCCPSADTACLLSVNTPTTIWFYSHSRLPIKEQHNITLVYFISEVDNIWGFSGTFYWSTIWELSTKMTIHLDIGLTHPMQVNRKWICKEFVNIDTVHTRFCVFMTVVRHFQMTWCTESKASFFMCDKWPLPSLSHGQCYGKPTAIYTLSGVTFDLFQDGGRKWWRLHPTPQMCGWNPKPTTYISLKVFHTLFFFQNKISIPSSKAHLKTLIGLFSVDVLTPVKLSGDLAKPFLCIDADYHPPEFGHSLWNRVYGVLMIVVVWPCVLIVSCQIWMRLVWDSNCLQLYHRLATIGGRGSWFDGLFRPQYAIWPCTTSWDCD